MSFWPVNEFHIQILAVALVLCWHQGHRENFWLRLITLGMMYCALPFFVEESYFAPFLCIGWFTFGFLIMVILCGVLMSLCFRMPFRQIVFYCCLTHTLQHITHCLSRLAMLTFSLNYAASNAAELVIFAGVLAASRFMQKHSAGLRDDVDMKRMELLIFALASSAIVYCVSLWASSVQGESIGVHLFDLFCCTLMLMILLDTFRLRKAEREQLILLRLLRQEQNQHEISKDTMDVINRKCHDLRHQIAALRHMGDDEKEKSISELENAVMIYDSFPKSGNEDLDIILAEKSLLAEKHHISVRCIVDGGKLSFMKLEDLYSLMGNALDNAIEATGQEDETKRIILLYAAAKGSLFSIHLENPCSRKPLFMDGLPVTNKPDTDYHGYGVRSMRYLCEKYGGALTTGWEDGIFSLDILFPLNT